MTAANRARDKLIADFNKSYGEGTMSRPEETLYEVISTGSVALDRAVTIGGYPIGRETEMWGTPDGGKTSLALMGAAEAQIKFPDRDVIFVDVEHKYDAGWARAMGADPSRIFLVDPLSAENTADMVKDSIRSNAASMVIVDSIGAVLTQKEFDKAADESDMGKRAQVVSRMILIATGLAPRHRVAVVVLNQARASFAKFGADTKPSGGFVPAHASTLKLHVKRASAPYTIGSEEKKIDVGYEMGVKVERSKVGPSGRNVKFDFFTLSTGMYGPVGVDKIQEAFKLGKNEGIIVQSGAYYTFPDGERVKSAETAMDYLRERPKLFSEIREKILAGVADQVIDDGPVELTPEQIREVTG